MEREYVTPRDLERIKNEIVSELSQLLQGLKEKDNEKEYLTQAEVCEMLDICPKQFKKLRDQRLITYSRFGKKIYVKRSDLREFMNNHVIRRRLKPQWSANEST